VDTLKVVRNPEGEYLVVYHVGTGGGGYEVDVATSGYPLTWTDRATVDVPESEPVIAAVAEGSFERLASMPTCIVINKPQNRTSTAVRHFYEQGSPFHSDWLTNIRDLAPTQTGGAARIVGPGDRSGSALGPVRVYGYRQDGTKPLLHTKMLYSAAPTKMTSNYRASTSYQTSSGSAAPTGPSKPIRNMSRPP
jgi:hypothetical protein